MGIRSSTVTALTRLSQGIVSLGVLLFFVVGLRGCVVTAWVSPEEIQSYSIVGRDDRVLGAIFLPENEILFTHIDPKEETMETAFFLWRGELGKKYPFGWHHFPDSPMPGPNWRRAPEGFEPLFMEQTVLEKTLSGPGESNFPEEGYWGYDMVFFAIDSSAIIWSGMRLDRDGLSAPVARGLAALISDSSAVAVLRRYAAEK